MKKILICSLMILAFAVSSCCQKKEKVVLHKVKETPDLIMQLNGQPVYEKDLGLRTWSQLFDMKKRVIDGFVKEKLLKEYLEKKGYDQKTLFEKEIKAKVTKPTEAEIKDFYEKNKKMIRQPLDKAKEMISGRIEKNKMRERQMQFFEELMSDTQIVYYFGRPTVDFKATDQELSHGPANAPVTLVEISEFRCPHCARSQEVLKKLKKKFGNKIRFIYKHFLLGHPMASESANASYCANEQKKFWEYHNILFEKQREISEENIVKWAEELKLNMADFKKCYEAKKYNDLIQRDTDYVKTLGFQSTPSFIVNNNVLIGAKPYEEFVQVIEDELAKKK